MEFSLDEINKLLITQDDEDFSYMEDEDVPFERLLWNEMNDLRELHSYLIDNFQSDDYWSSKNGNEFWNNYRLIEVLGEGSFGMVVAVEKEMDNNERRLLVLKIFLDRLIGGNIEKSYYYKEISILNEINNNIIKNKLSPNFVKIYNSFTLKFNDFSEFPDNSKWKTDLKSLENKISIVSKLSKKIEENERKKYIDQINILTKKYDRTKEMKFFKQAERLMNSFNAKRHELFSEKFEIGFIEMEWATSTLEKTFNLYDIKFNDLNYKKGIIKSIIFQLISGLSILKIKNIQHRDISSNNIAIIKNENRDLSMRGTYRYLNSKYEYNIPNEYQEYNILYIDFSHTQIINNNIQFLINYPRGKISYRPPEFYFLSTETIYDEKSDIFSLGISILELIINAADPSNDDLRLLNLEFLDFGKDITERIGFIYKELSNLCESELLERKAKKFICGEEKNVYYYIVIIYNLILLLGWPKNKDFPYIEETKLWNIFNKYVTEEEKTNEPLLWTKHRNMLEKYLGIEGINLLKSMLKWNPNERIDSLNDLNNIQYFNEYRSLIKEIQGKNTWGHLEYNNNFYDIEGNIIKPFIPSINRNKNVIGNELKEQCDNPKCNNMPIFYSNFKENKTKNFCSQYCSDLIFMNEK
jgi:serine/threonine protein kinase